ncbi:MAG: translation elongation factor Ts [Ignavibacteriaceae bacterium]|nr:translation elongation factor Ts [Ignavibacteriaceae bacterium]
MSITAAQVNELRQKTGAGMMDCKKALTEADGDFEKAIDILRKKGASVAAKRAEKSANEGMVETKVSDDGKFAAIVEVNCETDFVAKSSDFVGLTNAVLQTVFSNKISNVDDLLNSSSEVKSKLIEVMGKVGEKVEISRVTTESADNGLLVDYVHMGSKLAVLVKFDNVTSGSEELLKIGKDIAMQVAAMRPLCVYREEVPADIIEKEMEIYKELARKEGKPEQILEKIATGRLNKFYQENCLSEQAFIKDNTKTVSNLIDEFNKKNQTQTKITLFKRFHLGDEKK